MRQLDRRLLFLVNARAAEDTIVIWSALLTKKRVCVTSSNVDRLLAVVRALPLLVFHRQNWNLLRPLVAANDATALAELKSMAAFVAGFADAALAESLADVLVDVDERRVRLFDKATRLTSQTSLHASLAEAVVETQQKAKTDALSVDDASSALVRSRRCASSFSIAALDSDI